MKSPVSLENLEEEPTIDMVPHQEATIKMESRSCLVKAQDLAADIKDQASYLRCADYKLSLRGIRQKAIAFFKPMKDKANAVVQEIRDREKEVIAPIEKAELIINPALVKWDREQQRLRQEEQDRVRAEQRRQDEEARAQAAERAVQDGEIEQAEAIFSAPVVPVSVVLPKVEKPAGISYKKAWSAEVSNKIELIRAVAGGLYPLELLDPNMVALNGMARALKEGMSVPGVKAVSKDVVS